MEKKTLNKLAMITLFVGIVRTSFAASTIIAKVNGMVCAFCAQGIEKKFKKEPAVEKVDVKLEDKTVTLAIRDGQNIDDTRIKKLLIDSGYSVDSITRK